MKRLPLVFLTLLLLTGVQARAEPKAFERVTYRAKAGYTQLRLNYADGYVGGSSVIITPAHGKPMRFTPTSGALGKGGTQTFHNAKSRDSVTLKGLDETRTAPATLRGTYRSHGLATPVRFRRS